MRKVVLGLAAAVAVLAAATSADAGPITFVDVHAPAGGVTIDPTTTSYQFWHSILAPSDSVEAYDPLTDVLDDASLELTFSNSTQGNDRVSVTLSNFNSTLTSTVANLTGGFGPALLFDVQITYLTNQGLLNVLLQRGAGSVAGSSWTFLSSTLTVEATRTLLVDTQDSPVGATAPEPASLVLLGAGLAGLAARRRRRQ